MSFDGRVLVTGATGFLGGTVARHLCARGTPVVAVGRNTARLAQLRQDGIAVIEMDLRTAQAPPTGSVDAVVHCAALSAPWGPLSAFQSANVTGTDTALALARACGARRFVNISSPTIYFAMRDQDDVAEDMPLPPPINAYAATKAEAEQRVLAARDLGPISLRPRGIYGAGDTALLPRLLTAAQRGPLPLLRGAQAAIDLTHITDVIAAIDAALTAGPEAEGEAFNISGGEPLPVRHIVDSAAARAGVTPRWRAMPFAVLLAAAQLRQTAGRIGLLPGEPRITPYTLGLFAFRQSLCLHKAAHMLNWTPSVPFAKGLDLTFQEAAT